MCQVEKQSVFCKVNAGGWRETDRLTWHFGRKAKFRATTGEVRDKNAAGTRMQQGPEGIWAYARLSRGPGGHPRDRGDVRSAASRLRIDSQGCGRAALSFVPASRQSFCHLRAGVCWDVPAQGFGRGTGRLWRKSITDRKRARSTGRPDLCDRTLPPSTSDVRGSISGRPTGRGRRPQRGTDERSSEGRPLAARQNDRDSGTVLSKRQGIQRGGGLVLS